MDRFIALLRGVNVGGNNMISMPKLKSAFEAQGFSRVSTYINSGNIIFDAQGDETALQRQIEAVIEKAFALTITVCVLRAQALIAALDSAPDWWNADADSKHNAIFVIPPMTAAEICEQVGEVKPEYEKVAHHGPVVFWSAPIKTFSRTRWSKITQSKAAYNHITIRNANTAKKLAALLKDG